MKKIFSLILVMLSLFTLSGCLENDYVENEGKITLSIGEDYVPFMAYTAPTFDLEFDGTIKTLAGINYNYYTSFTTNDDLVISALIENLLTKYSDRSYVLVDDVKQGNTTRLNRVIDGEYVSGKVRVDDSLRYYETAYLVLDNGMQLCITYCRFVTEGKTIYRFRETKNIELCMLYPLMVIDSENPKFICVPLPFLVTTKISGNSTKKAEQIIGNSDYVAKSDTDVSYYVYDYPEIENGKDMCMNYYSDYFDASIDEDMGILEYLGYSFSLHFYDKYFTIRPNIQ